MRAATGIASDSVEMYKGENNIKSEKTQNVEEDESNCTSLIGATPDRYLRYVYSEPSFKMT